MECKICEREIPQGDMTINDEETQWQCPNCSSWNVYVEQKDCSQSALNDLLGPKHTGCRISAPGILGRIRDGWKLDNGMRYATGEMLKHLEETAKRFYAGDLKAIDEFLQLYCLDETRP